MNRGKEDEAFGVRPRRGPGPLFLGAIAAPVVAIGLYFGWYATDRYLCESVLSVQAQGAAAENLGDRIGALAAGRVSGANIHLVDEYIHSPAMLQALQDRHDLRAHFSHSRIDLLSRLGRQASWEEFHRYYNKRIETRVNGENGFIHLAVRSYAPEYCRTLSKTILSEAETFVNGMSRKMRQDFLAFAAEQLRQAETDMIAARAALALYQKERHILDPEQSAGNAMGIIGRLEADMAAAKVELADKMRFHNPSSPAIQAIRSRRDALQKQIDQENARLTQEQKNGGMTQRLAEYQNLQLQIEFARQRYEAALSLWQAAQAEALRKNVYIVPVGDPRAPETAIGLNRLREVFGWSFAVVLAYMLAALFVLSVRDHMES